MRRRSTGLWIVICVWSFAAAGCDDGTMGPDATTGFDAGEDSGGPDTGTPDSGVDCLAASDGTSCAPLMICLAGSCQPSTCGDGYVDADRGEECEDGNAVPEDGCEPLGCVWTCTTSEQCDDEDICTGAEVCQADHTCTDPADLGCDDSNPCTADSCDPLLGCEHSLIDGDGDGFAWAGLGACGAGTAGGDCDDTEPTTHPGAYDGCDGAMVNSDCDSLIDEDGAGHWYADCDGDAFAAIGAEIRDVCEVPTSGPAACPSGGWTISAPTVFGNTDCDDTRASVHPGLTEEVGNNRDDNCDGAESCYRDRDDDGYRTDEIVASSDADCNDSGESPASDPLEWTSAGARHICCDQNASVHAGQTAWFDFNDDRDGNQLCPAGRRWDYDCNGTETRRWTATLNQCFWEPAGCSRGGDPDTSGWFTSGGAPACGFAAPILWASNCHSQGATSCSLDYTSRFQECH